MNFCWKVDKFSPKIWKLFVQSTKSFSLEIQKKTIRFLEKKQKLFSGFEKCSFDNTAESFKLKDRKISTRSSKKVLNLWFFFNFFSTKTSLWTNRTPFWQPCWNFFSHVLIFLLAFLHFFHSFVCDRSLKIGQILADLTEVDNFKVVFSYI